MTYHKWPSSHFDRRTILLLYIVREAFFEVRLDGPSLHTHTHSHTFYDSKSDWNMLYSIIYVNLRPYLEPIVGYCFINNMESQIIG